MKKSLLYLLNRKMLSPILLATFFLLLTTACSLDSDTGSIDLQENSVEKSFNLELSKSVHNPEFRTALTNALSNSNFKIQGDGNGIMVTTNPSGMGWFLFGKDGIVSFDYGPGEGSIKFLPNGKAQFFAKTTNATASVFDFNTATEYSNVCEETGATLMAKVTGEYEVIDFGFGIFYWITKYQTAEVWRLKPTLLTNALQGYEVDEDWNFTPICGEATDSKTLSVNITGIINNKNPDIKIDVKLD